MGWHVLSPNWKVISFYSQVAPCQRQNTVKINQKHTSAAGSWTTISSTPWRWWVSKHQKGPTDLGVNWIDPSMHPFLPPRLLLRGAPASVLLPEEPESLKMRLKGLRLLGAFIAGEGDPTATSGGLMFPWFEADGPASMKGKDYWVLGSFLVFYSPYKQKCMCLTTWMLYLKAGFWTQITCREKKHMEMAVHFMTPMADYWLKSS